MSRLYSRLVPTNAMGEHSLKSPRTRRLRAILSLCAFALVAALLAACGGGSSDDAKATINKAFSTQIKGANINLALNAKVDGASAPQLSQPISVKLSGPFQSNGRTKLPTLNWQASFSGGGQSASGGLISTGDRAFVSYQGSNYELPAAQVAQINQQLGSQGNQKKSLKDYGIDVQSWLTNAQDKGDENVNGADTSHVQADVDVGKMLTDLNKVVAQASAVTPSAPSQITPQQIDQIKQVVKNPKMDVFVSKDDDTLRRLNVSVDFSIPEAQRSQLQGATGGNLTFSLDLSDVNKPQTVTPPSNAKPFSQLQSQLGGGTTGGSGLGGGSGSGGSGGSGSGSSGSGGGTSSKKAQEWAKCLQQAGHNAQKIQECNKILQK
jgi:hypothetical protein